MTVLTDLPLASDNRMQHDYSHEGRLMIERVRSLVLESLEVKQRILEDPRCLSAIAEAAKELRACRDRKGTIYACGNGGSACDAMHLCEELAARYKRERPGIRAMHFMDGAYLSCWSNDYDFQTAFTRGVETYCTPNDVLIAISTSGNSSNVLAAVAAAKQIGTYTIGLTSKLGQKLATLVDKAVCIPAETTERIQEAHILTIHIFCELLET